MLCTEWKNEGEIWDPTKDTILGWTGRPASPGPGPSWDHPDRRSPPPRIAPLPTRSPDRSLDHHLAQEVLLSRPLWRQKRHINYHTHHFSTKWLTQFGKRSWTCPLSFWGRPHKNGRVLIYEFRSLSLSALQLLSVHHRIGSLPGSHT